MKPRSRKTRAQSWLSAQLRSVWPWSSYQLRMRKSYSGPSTLSSQGWNTTPTMASWISPVSFISIIRWALLLPVSQSKLVVEPTSLSTAKSLPQTFNIVAILMLPCLLTCYDLSTSNDKLSPNWMALWYAQLMTSHETPSMFLWEWWAFAAKWRSLNNERFSPKPVWHFWLVCNTACWKRANSQLKGCPIYCAWNLQVVSVNLKFVIYRHPKVLPSRPFCSIPHSLGIERVSPKSHPS